jgi:predicted ATPase
LAGLRGTGASLGIPFQLVLLADICFRTQHPSDGLERLAEAEHLLRATQGRWLESELCRLRGEIHNLIGDWAAAQDSFRQAITTARQQKAKFWELRASTSLARLWRDQGKRTEARDLLAPIYGWFTEGFGTPDLKEAKALLDELVTS